jgi:glycerol-3-phosphate dehydrogenase subunit C
MSSDKPISYMPTEGLCYDPDESTYWEEKALNQELLRVFEVCHGCRMCFKYCDAFSSLFKFIDEKDGDVRKLSSDEIEQVMDDCFQCKLCEVQCPYTPRDNHEYQLDFPKLVHRYKALRNKRQGSSLRDRILADPDKAGRMARMSLGMANVMNRVKANRVLMELVLGIHREKLLPDFARETFEKWAARSGKIKSEQQVEAVLFHTCYVQNNEPDIGKDTIEVLEKNGVNVTCAKGLKCCGMPAWEHGDLKTLRENARHNLDILMPYVEKGAKVLVINPTCAMMMRREYPEMLSGQDRQRAGKLAEAVMEPAEFLWSIREEERFNTDFKSTPGQAVGYHAPCHLRAQAIGFKGRDLMRKIPGLKPKIVMECCGHDGTYAMKKQGFETSKKVGRKAFEGMKNTHTEVWATECPLAAIQFKQHAGKKALHPMTVLKRAYEENGFPNKIEEKKPDETSNT